MTRRRNTDNSSDEPPYKFTWISALLRCRKLTGWQLVVGVKLGLMGTNGPKSATTYAGVEKLSEFFGGRKPSSISAWRGALVQAGWLTDSGERRYRTILYKLTVPQCDCVGCSTEPSEAENGRPRDAKGKFLPS
ncbi:hypothetical protein [Amycolatopsis kentuckyensis]|uniref:hypothetical protein n=1 Tax=Amycolatopsis kentuckyensis TaxID=218823 RepID=UPI0011778888|nr:hypothetical protein [Amycolatopsis kentuckyensis]